MLLDGELEAALYPETLPSIRSGNPKVALLFPDPKKAEIEYYKNGGFFPIMHTVVVKNPILAEHPWVGNQLGASISASERDLLRAQQRPAQLRLGLGSGSHARAEGNLRPGSMALQFGRQSQGFGSGYPVRVRARDDQEKAGWWRSYFSRRACSGSSITSDLSFLCHSGEGRNPVFS